LQHCHLKIKEKKTEICTENLVIKELVEKLLPVVSGNRLEFKLFNICLQKRLKNVCNNVISTYAAQCFLTDNS